MVITKAEIYRPVVENWEKNVCMPLIKSLITLPNLLTIVFPKATIIMTKIEKLDNKILFGNL